MPKHPVKTVADSLNTQILIASDKSISENGASRMELATLDKTIKNSVEI